jgi:predicted Zn-dependent peptidase
VEFREHTLGNGLEIVAECDGEAHSTAMGFFVQAGSRDESDEIAGVSHFLEHMAFKGTPTRSADDVNREFDAMGAHHNAGTSEENTVYYAAMLPEYQDKAVELLGDILRPSLREDDFETEKQVIIEEIRMYEDQPPFGADEKCRAAHFGSHPLGRSVLGTVQSITDLTAEAMRDYFRRRYSPTNIALVACGRVDFARLVAAAEQACGGWAPFEALRTLQSPATGRCFETLVKETATQQYAILLSDAPDSQDTMRFAAKLLANILGDDSGSRLYWELVDPGLAEHVSLGHNEHLDAGLMATFLCCDPEIAEKNLQRIVDVYRQAEAEGITAAELEQAKSKVRSRIVLSSERPRGRLFSVGSDWTYRHQYCSVRNDLDILAAVSLDEVMEVLSRYPLTRGTTLTIGPLAEMAPPT